MCLNWGRFRIELFGLRLEAERRLVMLTRSKVKRGYRQAAAAS
jgi:predicted DNA-binding WGR domain protein